MGGNKIYVLIIIFTTLSFYGMATQLAFTYLTIS